MTRGGAPGISGGTAGAGGSVTGQDGVGSSMPGFRMRSSAHRQPPAKLSQDGTAAAASPHASLQVVGSALVETSTSGGGGRGSSKPVSRTNSLTQRPSVDAANNIVRIPRPSEVYAAAVAELQDADSASLLKLQQLRGHAASPTPLSPVRKRSSSAYAPGALPALPASPSAPPSLITRASGRLNEAPAAASILSLQHRRAEDAAPGAGAAARPGTVVEYPTQPCSPSGRRITSAPGSHCAQPLVAVAVTGTSLAPEGWRPAAGMQEPALRTGPGVPGPRADLHIARSSRTAETAASLPEGGAGAVPVQADGPLATLTPAPTSRPTPSVSAPSGTANLPAGLPVKAICTVFSSPGSGESTPVPSTPAASTSGAVPLFPSSRLGTPSSAGLSACLPPGAALSPPAHAAAAAQGQWLPTQAVAAEPSLSSRASRAASTSRAVTPAAAGTPTSGGAAGLWPRPPGEQASVGSPARRPRRTSALVLSPDSRPGSPKPPGDLSCTGREPSRMGSPSAQQNPSRSGASASAAQLQATLLAGCPQQQELAAEASLAPDAQPNGGGSGYGGAAQGGYGGAQSGVGRFLPSQLLIPLPSMSSTGSAAPGPPSVSTLPPAASSGMASGTSGSGLEHSTSADTVVQPLHTPVPVHVGGPSVGLTAFALPGLQAGSSVGGSGRGDAQSGGGAGSAGGSPGAGGVAPYLRPGSSNRGRAVQALVDAVRSRDAARCAETLHSLRRPSSGGGGGGRVLGLNDPHPVTGRTPLHEAVMLNHAGMVRALLAAGADPNTAHASQGPPLLHAAAWGETAMLALLLDAGADITAHDVAHYTALHYACTGGHVDAVRLLLDRGADAAGETAEGDTPQSLAAGHPAIATLLARSAASVGQSDFTLSPAHSAQLAAHVQGLPLSGSGSPAGSRQPCWDGEGPWGDHRQPLIATATATGISVHAASGASVRHAASFSAGALLAVASSSGAAEEEATLPSRPASFGGSGARGAGGRLRQPHTRTLSIDESSPGSQDGFSGPGIPGHHAAAPSSPPHAAAIMDAGGGHAAEQQQQHHHHHQPQQRSMRRLPSKGANLQDIIHAFEDEDQELIQHGASGLGTGSGASPRVPPAALNLPTPVAAALGPSNSSGGGGASLLDTVQARLQSKLPPRSPKASPAPWRAVDPPGPSTLASGPGSPHRPPLSPALNRATSLGGTTGFAGSPRTGLAAAVPTTPRFRFGIDILRNPPMAQAPPQPPMPAALDAPLSIAPSRQRSAGLDEPPPQPPAADTQLPALHPAPQLYNVSPGAVSEADAMAAASAARWLRSASAPAAGDVPIDLPSPFPSPDAAPAARHAPTTPAQQSQVADVGTPAAGPCQEDEPDHARASASSADTSTPPLVRDLSPPHSPRASMLRKRSTPVASPARALTKDLGPAGAPSLGGGTSGVKSSFSDAAGGGEAGTTVGGQGGSRLQPSVGSPCGPDAPAPAFDLLRVSQATAALAAAQAGGGPASSQEALALRALQMFSRSVELQTGGIPWTRGELLGEGSYARVYAGLNQLTGELMAVKVLQLLYPTSGASGGGGAAGSTRSREAVMAHLTQLTHELELYKTLSHRHVVGYIDHHFDPAAASLYIFLEYVPGGSIASMLLRFGRFSEELVRNYTRQLLLGLEYLHGCRVVHRDLKGGNVLVGRDGVIKLADFGASKAVSPDTITDCLRSVKGSVFWMAPEVIKGTGYNHKADIWSLGCTVIEMLTGRHPWPNLDNALTTMFQIAKQEAGPPRPEAASPVVLDFLDACLRYDPADRPSASELLLHPFVAGMGPGTAGRGSVRCES